MHVGRRDDGRWKESHEMGKRACLYTVESCIFGRIQDLAIN